MEADLYLLKRGQDACLKGTDNPVDKQSYKREAAGWKVTAAQDFDA